MLETWNSLTNLLGFRTNLSQQNNQESLPEEEKPLLQIEPLEEEEYLDIDTVTLSPRLPKSSVTLDHHTESKNETKEKLTVPKDKSTQSTEALKDNPLQSTAMLSAMLSPNANKRMEILTTPSEPPSIPLSPHASTNFSDQPKEIFISEKHPHESKEPTSLQEKPTLITNTIPTEFMETNTTTLSDQLFDEEEFPENNTQTDSVIEISSQAKTTQELKKPNQQGLKNRSNSPTTPLIQPKPVEKITSSFWSDASSCLEALFFCCKAPKEDHKKNDDDVDSLTLTI